MLGIKVLILVGFLCAVPVYAGVADEAFARTTMDSGMKSDISSLGQSPEYSLPIPVYGVAVSDLTDTWGDARVAGRTHEGIDIFAERGTAVISPTNAVVGSIGYGAIGGNFVFTINPGGERFYFAHLDSVHPSLARGDELEVGDIIGYVGNTGNASQAKPHLHFGIYTPLTVNPYSRLVQVYVEKTLEGNSEMVSAVVIPTRDLEYKDDDADVRLLQLFLINNSEGKERDTLARVGSTGYFGRITEMALIEYQKNNTIYPAQGYYGAITRSSITKSESIKIIDTKIFTRDLEKGMKGDDVLALQQFLNTNGFIVSDNGVGSPGYESKYFGPSTEEALVAFQQEKGIYPAIGYLGSITRSHIQSS